MKYKTALKLLAQAVNKNLADYHDGIVAIKNDKYKLYMYTTTDVRFQKIKSLLNYMEARLILS